VNKNTKEKDMLKAMFNHVPQDGPSVSFRASVMKQVFAEAVKARKRSERLALFSVIAASMVILALAIASIVYIDIHAVKILRPDLSSMPFYLYIGLLALLLLFADFKLRQNYKKRHSGDVVSKD
jgi:hypothetical protein